MLAYVLANTVIQHAGGPDEHAPCSRRSAEVTGASLSSPGCSRPPPQTTRPGPTGAGKLTAIASAYRAYAVAHPHLYRLMNYRPLRPHLLPEGLGARAARPLAEAAGYDEARARAMWAFAHGMVSLEIDGRFPPQADLDEAWRAGLAAFALPGTAWTALPCRLSATETAGRHVTG